MNKTFPLPLSLLLVLITGCVSPAREREAASRAAERLRADSARARYWDLQTAQKPVVNPKRYEVLPLTLPERTENGVIHTPTIEWLRIPLIP